MTRKNAWERIPLTHSFEKGILIDGYWDHQNEGFHCIFYVPEDGGKLLRWLDYSSKRVVRYLTPFPNGGQTIRKLLNPLTFKVVCVSDVPYESQSLMNAKVVERFQIPELQYYTYQQKIPGAWYTLKDGKLKQTGLDFSKKDEIRNRLMGETYDLINLALLNFPILDSPIPKFKCVAFDIEVGSPRHTFAVPEKAEFPVISVGLSSSDGFNAVLVLGESSLNDADIVDLVENHGINPFTSVEFFKSEAELIERLFTILSDFPFVLSFNGNSFDLPYLLFRAKKLNISYIPIIQHRKRPTDWQISGTVHIDLMSFFRNQAIRLYAFGGKYSTWNLDDIAEALLGKKKITHENWFDEMSQRELIAYNLRDAKITLELTQFSDQLSWTLIILLMRLGRIPITVLTQFSISHWIRQWLAFEHSRRGYLIPSKDEIIEEKGGFESTAGIDGKGYEGAIVLDPVPGVWWNVVVIDFASLYPSTIKRRNISYETIRCKGNGHERCKSNIVPGLSHWVCVRHTGLMSSLVGFVRDLRVRWYKQMKKKSTGKKKQFYDMVQASLKVFINASYGVFGAADFDLFCPPVAESTTAFARDALLTLYQYAEEEGIKVLYGDTDSLFLYQPPPNILEKIMFKMLIRHGMELGIDYNFKVLYLTDKKKNYFGFTKEGKIIIKGLQGKKSNTPHFIRTVFKKCLEAFSGIETEADIVPIRNEILSIIVPVVTQLKNQTIELDGLKTQYTLNKDLSEIRQKTPAVMIALQYFNNGNGKTHEIGHGSIFFGIRIKPILLHVVHNPFSGLNFSKGDLVEITYSEVSLITKSQVDWDYYLKTLKKTLSPILSPLNIDWDRDVLGQKSLEQFL